MGFTFKVNTEQVRQDAMKELSESHRANEGRSVAYLLEDDHIPDHNDGKDVFGIVYILHFIINDKEVVKVGVTQRDKVNYRVLEIIDSFFTQYRFYPYVYPKRFQRVERPYQIEAAIKKAFKDDKVPFKKSFSGSSEFFFTDLGTVVELYEKLVKENKNKK